MADQWFVKLGSSVKGPIDATKLRALVLRGVVTPDIEVRKGSSRWVPAGRVRGLFDQREEAGPGAGPDQGASPLWPGWQGFAPESPPEVDEAPEVDPLRALGLQGVAEAGAPDVPARGSAIPDSPIILDAVAEPEPQTRPEPPPGRTPESLPWNHAEPRADPDAEAGLSPLMVRIEEPGSILGDAGLPRVREAVGVSGKPDVADASEPSSRRRRAYLGYEGVVRSIGVLLYFNGFVGLIASVLWAKQVLDRLPALAGRGSDLRPYYTTVVAEGMGLFSLAGACFCLGAGLRSLRAWARWATVTLMTQAILVGFTVEMICLIQADRSQLSKAVAVLLVGMAAPGYVAQVMIRSEGEVVFTEAYREVVRRTPGIGAPWGLVAVALLVVEAAVFSMALFSAWKSIVAT